MTDPIAILHLASDRAQLKADSPLANELRKLATLKIVEQGKDMSDDEALAQIRQADVLLTMWGSRQVPAALAEQPGKVRYILNLTGTCHPFIPIEIIRSNIPVTNWGDAPAHVVAEGAVALLMAVLKDLRPRAEKIKEGLWGDASRLNLASGTLRGLHVGLYGCGAIGRRFVQMIAPFKPECAVLDPYATDLPRDCRQVESLETLFDESEAIVIWGGLNEQTKHSVTADLLARLPDHGIVINAARGAIIDQDALFAELKSGRLRAGLDVLSGNDSLPAYHEARHWPNLLLSCHDISSANFPQRPPRLADMDRVALANLRRFIAGEQLRFIMDERRYLLSS